MRVLTLVCSLIILLSSVPSTARAQPPDTLQVEAETVVYDQPSQRVEASGNVRLRYRGIVLYAEHAVFDLAQERLVAEGRVRFVDPQGRELRGESLTYDVRLSLAELKRAESIVDRVYIRAEAIRATPQRVTAQQAMTTTCDPARPAYRITAREIEIIPGQELTAHGAALWIGPVRVLSLPVLRMSLRSGEEAARSLPRLGYSSYEGIWVDYLYGYRLAGLQGGLYAKYATRAGFIPRNSLRYSAPAFALELITGLNQDHQARIFEQAELIASIPASLPGSAGLRLGGGVATGWFREQSTGVGSSRTLAKIEISFPRASLGENTTFGASLAFMNSWYGLGAWQATAMGGADLIHTLSEQTWVSLTYRVLDHPAGLSPFLFDTIPVADRVNQLSALLNRSGVNLGPLSSTVFGGVGYSFRDRAPLLIAGFSGRTPRQFSLGLTGSYNPIAAELKLVVDTGIQVGYQSRLNVIASYNARTSLFEDLDYVLTARLCDCFQATLRYRQVRREIWLEVGLVPDAVIGFPSPPE